MSLNLSEYMGVAFDLDDTLIDRKSAYSKFIEIMLKNFEIFQNFSKNEAQKYFWNLSPNNSFNISKALEKIKIDPSSFGGKNKSKQPVLSVLKRPEAKLVDIYNLIKRPLPEKGVLLDIETTKKYAGYIERQNKEIKKIKQIDQLNFVGLKNCGHLPHVDLPSLTGKIIYDYFSV